MITQERLKELFDYDESTGLLTRKIYVSGGRKKGSAVGCDTGIGYLSARVEGDLYLVHRLIMMLVHGYLTKEIDHINGNGKDNRLENLRHADRFKNGQNMSIGRHNKSGKKGVSRSRKGWRGSIDSNGIQYQKRFKTFDEAAKWVDEKRSELHGEFACYGGRLSTRPVK